MDPVLIQQLNTAALAVGAIAAGLLAWWLIRDVVKQRDAANARADKAIDDSAKMADAVRELAQAVRDFEIIRPGRRASR